jgi:NMD protein affecting ribosome stability and mRNA decay
VSREDHPERQRACVRCGRLRMVKPGRAVKPLCRDCRLVTTDLGETQRWAS